MLRFVDESWATKTQEEILSKYNELMRDMQDCFKSNEEYCEEQGWPSNGSNYELMCEDDREFYRNDLDYLYDLLQRFEEE